MSAGEVLYLRSALLQAAVNSFRPQVMLVDKHPLGVKKELRSALKVQRDTGGRAVLGLRDILDDRATVLQEWAAHDLPAKVEQYYDEVFIYGHRNVYDPINQYGFTRSMIERTRFCG